MFCSFFIKTLNYIWDQETRFTSEGIKRNDDKMELCQFFLIRNITSFHVQMLSKVSQPMIQLQESESRGISRLIRYKMKLTSLDKGVS